MNAVGYFLQKAGLVISRETTIRPLINDNIHTAIWNDKLQPLFMVDMSAARDFFAHDYAPDGINPYLKTLRQYNDIGGKLKYMESALYKYYCSFQPSTIQEVFFSLRDHEGRREIISAGGLKEYLLPWDFSPKRDTSGTLQYSGPMSIEKGECEFRRLIGVYESIRIKGYKPIKSVNLFNSNHIQGYFLKNGEKYRFVILHGKHRAAALSALGEIKLPVTFELGRPRVISIEQLCEWPQVYNGTYEKNFARDIFECFFY